MRMIDRDEEALRLVLETLNKWWSGHRFIKNPEQEFGQTYAISFFWLANKYGLTINYDDPIFTKYLLLANDADECFEDGDYYCVLGALPTEFTHSIPKLKSVHNRAIEMFATDKCLASSLGRGWFLKLPIRAYDRNLKDEDIAKIKEVMRKYG